MLTVKIVICTRLPNQSQMATVEFCENSKNMNNNDSASNNPRFMLFTPLYNREPKMTANFDGNNFPDAKTTIFLYLLFH